MPDGNEEEPSSDVEDDFETDEGLAARDAEHERAAAAAGKAGVWRARSPLWASGSGGGYCCHSRDARSGACAAAD